MVTEIIITTGMLTVEMMTEIIITTEMLMVEMQETFHPQVNNIKIGHHLIVVVTITDPDLVLAHLEGHLSEDRDAHPMVEIGPAVITEEHQVENLNHHQNLLNLVAHRQKRL